MHHLPSEAVEWFRISNLIDFQRSKYPNDVFTEHLFLGRMAQRYLEPDEKPLVTSLLK